MINLIIKIFAAWRQACYAPLVDIAARHGFDIDAVFAAHPRLAI
jgi:hypothetical protein